MLRQTRKPALAALVFVLAACSGDSPAELPAVNGPNVVILTLDTTRADFVTPLGADPDVTPNLAKLAERAWVFERAVSETNITNPSHITILSGVSAREHRVLTNDVPLPDDLATLPELLKAGGWSTAGFPSAGHLSRHPKWRGFDVLTDPEEVVDAPGIAADATDWIRGRGDRPFFLWAHFFDPHALYEPPPEIAERFYSGERTAGEGAPIVSDPYFQASAVRGGIRKWLGETRDLNYPRAMYAAELHYADVALGNILDALEASGVVERTIIVVVADHGESLDEHGVFYDHVGLYEPQLRIPLVIAAPGLGSGRNAELVTTLDVAPTVAELVGLELDVRSAGRSLVPLMGGGAEVHMQRDPFVHMSSHNHQVAVRDGRWKAIVTKVARHPFSGEDELFDLEADPGETINLATEHPDRMEAMRELAQPWRRVRPRVADPNSLNDEARERLRALGYE